MPSVNYIVEYEYAAIALITGLLILFFARRKYPGVTNKLFLSMMLCTLLSAVTHVLSIEMQPDAASFPLFLNYFIRIVYLAAYNFDAVLFMLYISTLTKNNRMSRVSRIIAASVTSLELLLLVTTPFTKLIIYFGENMDYHHGSLFNVLLGVAVILLIYDMFLIIQYRRRLSFPQKLSLIMFEVLTVAAILLQLFIRSIVVGNFAIALALVMFLIILQNPDDFTDKAADCFNYDAFFLSVEGRMHGKTPFTVVAFRFDGLNYISGLFRVGERGTVPRAISERLQSAFDTDEIFHLGNCEFAMFTNDKRKMTEKYITDRLVRYFSRPLTIGDVEAVLTPKICLVHCPDFASSAEEVRDAIEYTLKASKKEEGSVFTATSEAITARKRELQVLSAIKKNIVNSSFEMYYQPIYDTAKKGFVCAEALIRMKDSELGFVSPDEFIPLAESNGMIIEVGEVAFRKVCEFMKSGRAQAMGVKYIEVNLSAVQCVQEQLSERLTEIMEEYGIAPQQINFEITETAGLANFDALLKNMSALISRGVTFSMDDYGTGFSTANYLISLPMDIVKIDKSILWPAMKSSDAFVILRHTVEMLKSLGKRIVVEGVETEEMAQLLIGMGCDYLQGYFYQRPVPGDEYLRFLENNQNSAQKNQ